MVAGGECETRRGTVDAAQVLIFEMIVGRSPFKPQRGLSDLQVCRNIVHRVIPYPSWIDPIERDIIDQLLQEVPENRLGAGPDGFWSLKNHKFFSGIDFDDLLSMKLPAPWKPKLKGTEDTRYFHCTLPEDEVQADLTDVWGDAVHFEGWDSPSHSRIAPDMGEVVPLMGSLSDNSTSQPSTETIPMPGAVPTLKVDGVPTGTASPAVTARGVETVVP